MEANKILTSLVSCNRIGYNIWLVATDLQENQSCLCELHLIKLETILQKRWRLNIFFRPEVRSTPSLGSQWMNADRLRNLLLSSIGENVNRVLFWTKYCEQSFFCKIRIGKQFLVKLISRPFHWRDLEENAMAVCSQMVWKHNWPHCSLHNPPP